MNKNRADELSNDKNHEVSYIYNMYNATKYPIAGLGILGLGYYIGSNFGSNQGFIHNFIAKYIGRSEA